jgi:hypothetical protein
MVLLAATSCRPAPESVSSRELELVPPIHLGDATMLWASRLADLIVVFHVTYVCFILFGLAAILLGVMFLWNWVRNAWFRAIHLITIAIVVGESLVGMRCPLTVWEAQLRKMAGQTVHAGDFLGRWAHQLCFFRANRWVFTLIYTLFGMAVLAAFFLAPPRRSTRGRIEIDGGRS